MSQEDSSVSPREVVEENFGRMRDPDQRNTAPELYADDVTMDLPRAQFEGETAAERMVEYFDSQYEWCKKEFEEWYEVGNTVFTIGTLYGVDNDGEEFEGIRFIDIHAVKDGEITRKLVFNDLSEAGIVDYDDVI